MLNVKKERVEKLAGAVMLPLIKISISLVALAGILVPITGTFVHAQMPGPNEVIAYEHINFVGAHRSWKLEPGMRQKLVPYVGDDMNDRISSIHVGSGVGVAVFQHADFQGPWWNYQSTQTGLPPQWNDQISSLIVYPKAMVQPLGVYLEGMTSGAGVIHAMVAGFFPAPERMAEPTARYPFIGKMMNDAVEMASIYPNDSRSPVRGKIEVRLCEHTNFAGRCITIPGPGSDYTIFKLGDYQFSHITSSVEVSHKP